MGTYFIFFSTLTTLGTGHSCELRLADEAVVNSAVFQAEVEETLKRIQSQKGVQGIIVANSEGFHLLFLLLFTWTSVCVDFMVLCGVFYSTVNKTIIIKDNLEMRAGKSELNPSRDSRSRSRSCSW